MKLEAAERKLNEEALQLELKKKASIQPGFQKKASMAPNKTAMTPTMFRSKSTISKDFPSDQSIISPSVARNKSVAVNDSSLPPSYSKLKSSLSKDLQSTTTINENYTSNFNTENLSVIIPSESENNVSNKSILSIKSPAAFEISPSNFPPLYIRTAFWFIIIFFLLLCLGKYYLKP